ncbi:MAG: hypothetical protein KAT75_04320 [Dehalococcoidia bacterium]|nr:hypothetical protein [Dehalococcoidia bacterium]
MKCPIMILADHLRPGGYVVEIGDCIKEECAWWRDDLQMCSVKDLSLELMYTQFRLQDIVVKMPYKPGL